MGEEIIPALIELFKHGKDRKYRAFLVEVVYQFRKRDVIPFLAEALGDTEAQVWKTALDGLVAVACPEAIDVLHTARSREFVKKSQTEEFQLWLEEAIGQAEEKIKKNQE